MRNAGSKIIKIMTPRKGRSTKKKKKISPIIEQKRAAAQELITRAELVFMSKGYFIAENGTSDYVVCKNHIDTLINLYQDADHSSAQRFMIINRLSKIVATTQDESPLYLLTFLLNERERLAASQKLSDYVRRDTFQQALAWAMQRK